MEQRYKSNCVVDIFGASCSQKVANFLLTNYQISIKANRSTSGVKILGGHIHKISKHQHTSRASASIDIHQGHRWASRSSVIIKDIGGHQGHRWVSRSLVSIKDIGKHQGHRWASRTSGSIKEIYGHQGHRWASRSLVGIKVIGWHQGHR